MFPSNQAGLGHPAASTDPDRSQPSKPPSRRSGAGKARCASAAILASLQSTERICALFTGRAGAARPSLWHPYVYRNARLQISPEEKLMGVSPLFECKVLFVSFSPLKRSAGGLNDKITGFKISSDECQADPPNVFTFDARSPSRLQFKTPKRANLSKRFLKLLLFRARKESQNSCRFGDAVKGQDGANCLARVGQRTRLVLEEFCESPRNKCASSFGMEELRAVLHRCV